MDRFINLGTDGESFELPFNEALAYLDWLIAQWLHESELDQDSLEMFDEMFEDARDMKQKIVQEQPEFVKFSVHEMAPSGLLLNLA